MRISPLPRLKIGFIIDKADDAGSLGEDTISIPSVPVAWTDTNSIIGTSGNDSFSGFVPGVSIAYTDEAGTNAFSFDMDSFGAGTTQAIVQIEEGVNGSVGDISVAHADSVVLATDWFSVFGTGYAVFEGGMEIVLHYSTWNSDISAYDDLYVDFERLVGGPTVQSLSASGVNYEIGSYYDDTILGASGAHTIDGGPGTNTIDYSAAPAGVTVDLATGTADNGWSYTDTLTNIQNVTGSAYSDIITGDSHDNVIDGGAGSNTLNGGGGTNTLDYSHDPASVYVDLSSGIATNGYSGTDTISNFQNVIGSDHGDTIIGNSANNVITGGAGDDLVINGGGSNTYDGGDGTNTLSYANDPSGVMVDLSTGTATNGWAGTDTITHFQNVIGSVYDDVITGNSLDNVIDGGAGNNTLDGGGGTNTLDYSHDPAGVIVDLSAGTATNGFGGTDTISNFQNVIGSDHGDVITTSAGDNNIITCGAGDDTVIIAGSGNNEYDGGGGTNTLSYALDPSGAYVDLYDGYVYNGFGGYDSITNFQNVIGSAYDDTIFGDDNNNVISGGGGDNYLDGGAGTNTLDYSHDPAGVTVDLVDGWATNGWGGTDTIYNFQNVIGSDHGDTIIGNGNNVITGGAGDDLVINGGGSNDFDGGGGNNTLSYQYDTAGVTVDLSAHSATNGSSGTDTITNFQNVIGSEFGGDVITGDSHDNVVSELGGSNILDGGGGTNTLDYSHEAGGILAILGSGVVYTGSGSDTVSNFQNVIGSEFGGDGIYGDANNNVITPSGSDNYLDGGGGINTLDYSHDPAGVSVDIPDNTASNGYGGTDSIYNFQIIIGSHFDDTITGDGTTTVSYANAIGPVTVDLSAGTATGDGSDTLSGITGVIGSTHADTITCDSNNDTIDGNGGNDAIYCGSGADAILLNLPALGAIETIHSFSTANGDSLDIANLISSYDPSTDPLQTAINNFVELDTSGGNTQVKVDSDGSGTSFTQVATLAGVTGLNLHDLINDGNLIVHHA